MSPGDGFRQLLSTVGVELGKFGFHRRGSVFYLREGRNWGIAQVQRSGKSTSDSVVFTVNVGAASGVLLAFFGGREFRDSEIPAIDQCHWHQRLGFLLPEPGDRWWSIDGGTSLSALGNEINSALIQFGVPAIKTFMLDANLQQLWQSGVAPGLTEVERLKCLSVLLKQHGAEDEVEPVVQRLQSSGAGRPTADTIALHLERLDRLDSRKRDA